jgi:hypothetical protein
LIQILTQEVLILLSEAILEGLEERKNSKEKVKADKEAAPAKGKAEAKEEAPAAEKTEAK